jgi:hypothetical protein
MAARFRPYAPTAYCYFSVWGWVNPKVMVYLEGLGKQECADDRKGKHSSWRRLCLSHFGLYECSALLYLKQDWGSKPRYSLWKLFVRCTDVTLGTVRHRKDIARVGYAPSLKRLSLCCLWATCSLIGNSVAVAMKNALLRDVTRIGELRTTLAVTSNRSTLLRNGQYFFAACFVC